MLSPVGRELADVRAATSTRRSSPDLEAAARESVEERLESIRRKLLAVQDFVGELAAIGESDPRELQREVDLFEVVRAEVRILEARAARTGVEIVVRAVPDEPGARAPTRGSPRSVAALVRELVAHAISATPRGSGVSVLVHAGGSEEGLGARMVVDDGGTILPAAARLALLALEVEPGTFGRPSGVGLFLAAEIAAAQGALLELGDAPVVDGRGGGVRVSVTFPH